METHVRALAQAQAELGAEVRVVCVNHRDRRGDDVTWARFAATATVEEWDGLVGLTRLGRLASLARLEICPELPRVLRRLRGRGVNLLHLHVPNPTMLLALAAVRTRVPLVVTYHSDVVRQRRLALALRPFEQPGLPPVGGPWRRPRRPTRKARICCGPTAKRCACCRSAWTCIRSSNPAPTC